jgi:hypothetical protein
VAFNKCDRQFKQPDGSIRAERHPSDHAQHWSPFRDGSNRLTRPRYPLLQAKLPASAIKHDMEPGFDVMAEWILRLDSNGRAAVLSALVGWLRDEHPWHSRAVMEIALRLADQRQLVAAVGEPRKRGVHDLAATEEYPSWLIFHLDLLSTISRWPGDPSPEVRTYLNELRGGVAAKSYSRRLLAIRTWFTECLLESAVRRKQCLSEGLAELRKWRDPRLLRSGLSLLHAYFASTAEGVADSKEVLTREEFAMACPELVAC